jgi:hypothetical protein
MQIQRYNPRQLLKDLRAVIVFLTDLFPSFSPAKDTSADHAGFFRKVLLFLNILAWSLKEIMQMNRQRVFFNHSILLFPPVVDLLGNGF